MKATIHGLEDQIRGYAAEFLRSEYGPKAAEKLSLINITALDVYDDGGVSEATESEVKIAAKRDINAGKLTQTTKLILRHELGHILDEVLEYPDFEQKIQHEEIAWKKAKPKTAAEKWYRNVSMRTHKDPLKMMVLGFPRPETKLSKKQLERGTLSEIARMKRDSVWVDEVLAERYAMARLVENPNYYGPA